MRAFDFVVPLASEGRRIDQYLAHALVKEASRVEIQKVILTRGVELNGKKILERNTVLKPGDKVRIELDEAAAKRPRAEKIALDVVFEDDDLLVINKAAGMVVHPAPGHRSGTVVNALLGSGVELSMPDDETRPGIVHRLDKDTSGLLMVAKNNKTHRALTRMLQDRSIHKTYDALVLGRIEFEEGFVDAPIGRDQKDRYKMAVRRDKDARDAYTEYRVIERFGGATRLWVRLHSGRTHQIRVHMLSLGHPVIGDELYGERRPGQTRMGLHAATLEFEHPGTGETMRFEAPIPPDYRMMIDEARGS